MKYVIIAILLLLVLGIGGFYCLGAKSQGGVALGLVDGRLAPCPSSPNCVSSEGDTPSEKKGRAFGARRVGKITRSNCQVWVVSLPKTKGLTWQRSSPPKHSSLLMTWNFV